MTLGNTSYSLEDRDQSDLPRFENKFHHERKLGADDTIERR